MGFGYGGGYGYSCGGGCGYSCGGGCGYGYSCGGGCGYGGFALLIVLFILLIIIGASCWGGFIGC
ncbi:YjcZ family sporulation protein [Bacillus sp. UNC437CL72CviS29]|uniref:YjcZ family sporulation protein n=1 Tax=Bacillus sp. UNC437CL72CviS29 TaxID=1340430 RepID=UPI000479BB9E|nr:YjcZ family sporulation protein [Bacillus sp. UNC437CL72CviS29]